MSQDFDKEAWERGKTLFQEDLGQAKGKKHMDYLSMIDFAVDGYACLSPASIPTTLRSAIGHSMGIG